MEMQDVLKKFSKLIDIEDVLINSIFYLKFKNKKLEEKYSNYLMDSTRKMRMIVNFISLSLLILRFLDSCNANELGIDFIVDLITNVIALVLFIVLHFAVKSFKTIKVLSYTYTSYVSIVYAYSSAIYHFILPAPLHDQYQIKNKYILIIITIIEYLFILEYNFFLAVLLQIVDLATTILMLVLHINQTSAGYRELLVSLFVILLVFYLKRFLSVLQRQSYLQNYKIDKYFLYCHDLINNMNGLQFTMKKGKVVLNNENFKNYLLDSKITGDWLATSRNGNRVNFDFRMQKDSEPIVNLIEKKKGIEKEEKGIFRERNSGESFDFKNSKDLNCNNKNNMKEEQVFINAYKNTENQIDCIPNYENININNFNKNKIEKDSTKIEIINKPNIDHEIYVCQNYIKEATLENKNTNKKSKEENTYLNLNILSTVPKKEPDPCVLIENEKLRDILIEKYLSSIKPIQIEKEFEFLKEENLHKIFEKIRYSEINQNQNINSNSTNNLISFSFLGDFKMEEDNKFFQVYFRNYSEYFELMDFLVYDITKIKEAEEIEINLKSKFFAKIAHEFKTPLNSIIGLIKKMNKLFEDKNFKDSQINFTLKQIENLSNYVILLINDIIQSSNIYSLNRNGNARSSNGSLKDKSVAEKNLIKKANLKIEEINLKEITKFCKEVLQTLLISKEKEKYIIVKFSFDNEINKYKLISDEFRMKQMLLNLISNSVKFTKSGSITIKSKLYKEAKDENPKLFVKISIIDTGIGMEEKELKTLQKFKETNVLECGRNYNQEGSGLGLGITKYLADVLDHKLEIESCYSKGSCFSIILKVEALKKQPEKINKISDNRLKYESDFFHSEDHNRKNSMHKNESEKHSNFSGRELNESFSDYEKIRNISNLPNIHREIYKSENLHSNFENKFKTENNKFNDKINKKTRFQCSLKEQNHRNFSNLNKQVNYFGNNKEETLFYEKTTKEVTKSEKIRSRKIKTIPKSSKYREESNGKYNLRLDKEVFANLNKSKNNSNFNSFKNPNFSKFKKAENKIFDNNEKLSNEYLGDSTDKNSQAFDNPYKLKNLIFDKNKGKIKINKKEFASRKKRGQGRLRKRRNFIKEKIDHNETSKNREFDESSEISCLHMKELTSKKMSDSKEQRIDFIDFSNHEDSVCLTSLKYNNKKQANNKSKLDEAIDTSSKTSKNNDNYNKSVILLVDDHVFVRESIKNIICNILKKRGLQDRLIVVERKDGSDIIKDVIKDQFENNRISCVITDENMEFINGSEAIKIIKNLEKSKKIKPIKIASVTAYEDEITRNFIKNAGVDYIIPKPCTEKAVLDFFQEFNILNILKDFDAKNKNFV